MEYSQWNTASVAPARQFDLYRSGLCASFAKLTPSIGNARAPFAASVERWTGKGRELALIKGQSHLVERTRQDLKDAEDDHLYLNYMVRGRMNIRQGNMVRSIHAGDMIVLDNGRPFSAQTDSSSGNMHLALQVPRSMIDASLASSPDFAARHPVGTLLRSQFHMLASAPEALREEMIAPTVGNLSAMLQYMASALHDNAAGYRLDRTREAVLGLIRERYTDVDFSLPEAAKALGVSKRSLQYDLSAQGLSFSGLLREHRLMKAKAAIDDARNMKSGRTSHETIAALHGYRELSTFYRAFKRKFGCSPGNQSFPDYGEH